MKCILTIFGAIILFSVTAYAAEPRFADKGDGTIYDTVSNLTWLKDANCFGPLNWTKAKAKIDTLANGQCSLTDRTISGEWRVPYFDELYALRNVSGSSINSTRLADAGFTGVQPGWYWAAEQGCATGSPARAVSFVPGNAYAGYTDCSMTFYSWPVRPGQSWLLGDLRLYTAGTNFGDVKTEAPSPSYQLTLKNIGASNTSVTSTTISGTDATQFSVAPGGTKQCPNITPTLTAGDSCTLLVSAASPINVGVKSANLNITTAAGSQNIPLALTATDGTIPTISSFTVPVTSTSLTVGFSITATDNVAVTGYFLSEGFYPNLSVSAPGWTATAPSSYTFSTEGNKTLYVWAKDAAGNLSLSVSRTVLVDMTMPNVTGIVYPTTYKSLSIPINYFTATDNIGVAGFLITETNTRPLPGATGWSSTAPNSYTFSSAGTKKFYAWAKDAAGNISSPWSGTTIITINGVCGSSNGGIFNVKPTTNLCSAGTTYPVYEVGSSWQWSCAGLNGGTGASCSASIQTYTVTSEVTGGSGTVSCINPVNYGATSTCTVTPSSGYQFSTFTDNGVDNKGSVLGGIYTISNVFANHTIAVTFSLISSTIVNGTCGAANGTTVSSVPTSNLCSAGTATTVTGSGPWSWSCTGLNGGSTANCSATLDLGSCSPAPLGLVGWWPGDGNANDISGSANTGTITGSVSYQAGKVGQAFNFPGDSSSYVSTANPLTAITDNFSMVMWVKPNATRNSTTESGSGVAGTIGQQYAITPLSGGTTTAGAGVSVGTNGISVFEHGNSYLPSLLVYNAAITGWNHVAVVYENKTPRLYVNGVLVRQGIKSSKVVSPSALFGNGSTYGPYNGMLDEVQIFNRVLTVEEIQSNYSAAAGTCKPLAGSCGAANGTTVPIVPVSNFCSTGTATAISGSGPWSWSCAGLNGGATASCSANIQTYAVTSGVTGGNGAANCTSPVIYGADSVCSVTANSGYQLATFTDNSVDKKSSVAGGNYTISNVAANHAIAATFSLIPPTPVNGACGTASGTAVATAPTSGFCSTGTASAISGTGPWSWTCAGSGSGTSANCSTTPVDSTQPTLILSTLTDGSVTNNATLNVSGSTTDASGIKSLTVNSQAVTVAGNGSFTYPVILGSGANIITTVATDNADNQTTDSRTITLDATAPLLTISVPADNSKTAQVLATVTGTIDTTSTVTVKINSGTPQSAAVSGNSYSATVNLAVGLNTITVTATDLAGNTTSAVRSITYDNTNPSVAITNPSQDITTDQNSITITGTVSDTITTATVKITFNSQNYSPIITSGTFSQLLTIPAAGTYAITATATDEAGNSSNATRNLIYQKSGIVVPSPGKTRPSLADAMRVLNIAMDITTPTAADYAQGDIAPLDSNGKPKGNGVIDTYDAIGILRMVAGLL